MRAHAFEAGEQRGADTAADANLVVLHGARTFAHRRVRRDHPTRVMPGHPKRPDHGRGPTRRRSMASTEYDPRPAEPEVSGWAVGGLVFAASMMTLVGVFQVIAGLTAIFNDE